MHHRFFTDKLNASSVFTDKLNASSVFTDKLNASTFPGIDGCLMVTKWDFLEMEESL